MTAILCVGEDTRLELEPVRAVLQRQLSHLDEFDMSRLVIAYEPAWAIGTGSEPADPQWVSDVHAAIRDRLLQSLPAVAAAPVIYGGSVDTSNARSLMAVAGVDGLFVGRHALRPEVFSEIAHVEARQSTPR
jgi:triosephosphate isomerase